MTSDRPAPPSPSNKKVFISGAVALIVAAIVAFAFVLPAEFGIDPTGIGRKMGLMNMSDSTTTAELERGAKRIGVLTLLNSAPGTEAGMRDSWQVELGPYEAVEFKYTIPEGQRMAFTWRSNQTLNYDMHAHPFKGGVDFTESYGVGVAAVMHGRYVAPFSGIHGWYWQNRSLQPATLSLEATGGFSTSTIFDSTGEHSRPLVPPAD